MASNTGPTSQTVSLLQVISETTFGTDESGSLGSFSAVPFQEGTAEFTIPQETHDPMHAVQYMHDYREEVLGKKLCTLKFTMPFAPTGVAATAGVTQVQSVLGLILEQVLGAESPGTLAAGSQAGVGGWSSPDTGDVDDGSVFAEGSACGWVNAAGIYEMRPLQGVSTNTLTTKLAFSGNPAENDEIHNVATYYPTSDPSGSLQFAVRGLESNDDYILMGMQVTGFTITLPLDGTIPTISFDFVGVHWLRGADAAGSGSLTDITPVTYANTSPITAQSGRFMVQTAGTATYTGSTVNVSSVAFEPQHAFQQITSPSGIGGVLRHHLTRQNGPSIQGNFSTYIEDVSWWTKKEAKTDLLVLYQIGDTAGKSILLEAATCQAIDPERVDGNGIAEINVTWKGRRDGDQDVGTGDAGLRPYAISFG